MAEFTITSLTSWPGIVATAAWRARPPRRWYGYACLAPRLPDLKVGPFYIGPIPPQFNADGTLYVAPAEPEPEEPAAPEEE
jgi:hypothetical protein